MGRNHPVDTDVYDLFNVTIPNPGAGNPFVYICPPNTRIHILSITYTYNPNGLGSTRTQQLNIEDDSRNILTSCFTVQTMGPVTATTTYFFTPGPTFNLASTALAAIYAPIHLQLIIEPGERLQQKIAGIRSGDLVTDIFLRCKKWVLP